MRAVRSLLEPTGRAMEVRFCDITGSRTERSREPTPTSTSTDSYGSSRPA